MNKKYSGVIDENEVLIKNMKLIKKHHFFKKVGNISIFLFALLAFLGNPIYSYSQTQQYLIKDKEGLDFILNININGNVVNGYTREKALLDYITKTEYKAVKLLTAVKYPEIIRFKAKLDNTKFKGDYYALYNYRKVTGEIKGDSIFYSIFENEKFLKSYKGTVIKNYIKKDYVKLANDIVKATEDSIYDTKIIQSKKWQEFKKKLISSSANTYDDFEFQIGFFAYKQPIGY